MRALCLLLAWTAAAQADFLLISRDLDVQPVRLIAIGGGRVHFLPDVSSRAASMPVEDCLALFASGAAAKGRGASAVRGPVVQLADGQRLPGHPARQAAASGDALAWSHALLGELTLPLEAIEYVIFERGSSVPPAGESDVLRLTNGDVLEGFILELADPVVIEVESGDASRDVAIPLARIAAARMVARAAPGAGPRFWLSDGTILDVADLSMEEDGYVRFTSGLLADEAGPGSRVALTDVAGILMDRARLVPLASLTPRTVQGPATRYQVPEPAALEPDAVLGLSSVDVRGPLAAHYALPAGARRFAAMAELPAASRQWGDYELVLRSGERELLRTRLNAAQPQVEINMELSGGDLVIEIVEGEHGPIQCNLILHRPRLLVTE